MSRQRSYIVTQRRIYRSRPSARDFSGALGTNRDGRLPSPGTVSADLTSVNRGFCPWCAKSSPEGLIVRWNVTYTSPKGSHASPDQNMTRSVMAAGVHRWPRACARRDRRTPRA